MPTDLKRKSPPGAEDVETDNQPPLKRRLSESEATSAPSNEDNKEASAIQEHAQSPVAATDSAAETAPLDRLARFKALQARQADSRTSNRAATAAEAQRAAVDPSALTALQRKRAIATHKLLRADAAADGEDFERRRAWDWTAEESEKWDKRLAKKAGHRDDGAFADFAQQARKVYKRQAKALPADTEAYEREKAAAVERAAQNGGLEIVETEDGDVVAVDVNGAFYAGTDSMTFAENKPEKARVDALVEDLRKAEEVRLRKRKERARAEDDGDITYINDKNKHFNQKLARFYNKYTSDIRDSFERGTAI